MAFGSNKQPQLQPSEVAAQKRKEANFKNAFGKSVHGQVVKAKFLGVRTAEETKVLATYNSTVYCFLVEYEDGIRELLSLQSDDKRLDPLIYFIDMD